MLADKVIDGTPCSRDTFHICVNGLCKPAGCDHVLNSTAELDICGVCRGDNSTCQWITGSYNSTQYGYTRVAKIPAGSNNIDIRQHGWKDMQGDSNYLGTWFLSVFNERDTWHVARIVWNLPVSRELLNLLTLTELSLRISFSFFFLFFLGKLSRIIKWFIVTFVKLSLYDGEISF